MNATQDLPLHPWASSFAIKPDSHHIELAYEALALIEDILHGNTKKVTFLRMVTNKNRLKIYIEIDGREIRYPGGGIGSAIDDLCKEIEERSVLIKPACESDSEKKSNIDTPQNEPHSMVEIISNDSIYALDNLVKNASRENVARFKGIKSLLPLSDGVVKKSLARIASVTLLTDLAVKFPNFSELTEYINSQLTLSMLGDGAFRLPPILLLGEPGIGKTEFLVRLAGLLNTGFMYQNMASAQCGAMLAGSDVYWANSRPGDLFEKLVFGETANPIVMLDEIDKVDDEHGYSPLGSLYELLEKRTAKKFVDKSLPGVYIDASHVIWVAAGNEGENIDPAILSRFKVFNIPSPTKEQMPVVIGSVYEDLIKMESWGKSFPSALPDDVVKELNEIAPRELKRALETACATAAMNGRSSILLDDLPVRYGSRISGIL